MPKNLFIPKNGFRGGDTFCPPKGGTEREKKGTFFFGRRTLGNMRKQDEEKKVFSAK